MSKVVRMLPNSPTAYKLARKFMPLIICGIDSYYDFPCEITFAHFVFPAMDRGVPIYFWIRRDDTHYYIGYAVYHYRDYTDIIPAKPFDEHRHDFTGFVKKVERGAPWASLSQIITVSHYNFEFEPYHNAVFVKEGSHAISPIRNFFNPQEFDLRFGRHLTIGHNTDDVKLICLDRFSANWWKATKHNFNQHHTLMPDQWYDKGIGKRKTIGLMWTNPRKLFDMMEGV